MDHQQRLHYLPLRHIKDSSTLPNLKQQVERGATPFVMKLITDVDAVSLRLRLHQADACALAEAALAGSPDIADSSQLLIECCAMYTFEHRYLAMLL